MKSTRNPGLFLATLPKFGNEQGTVILGRFKDFLKDPVDQDDAYGLLLSLGDRFPDEARAIYQQWAESSDIRRRDTICNVLWTSPLARELLPPLLDDTRQIERYEGRMRICDRAAQAITNNIDSLRFHVRAPEAERDRQIDKIKRYCAGEEVSEDAHAPAFVDELQRRIEFFRSLKESQTPATERSPSGEWIR